MKSIYYSAAWTDSGFLLGCSHEHETIVKADSCIPYAGGYVVGVENGVMRSLTAAEESEFQRVHYAPRTDKPPLDAIRAASLEVAGGDSGYAVMTRIRVGDCWTWTTWMRWKTHAEAAAHAREGNKVVRFRTPEWAALRQHAEAASPILIHPPRESIDPQGHEETLVDFVLRFLSARGFNEQDDSDSGGKRGFIGNLSCSHAGSKLKIRLLIITSVIPSPRKPQ
jgi:hypothetical protein